MNYKIIGVLFVLLFIISTASAVTISVPTVSPSITSDRNYFEFPVTLTSTGSADINADSDCWFFVSDGGIALAGDWNTITDLCTLTIASAAGKDDYNFSVRIDNTAKDVNVSSDNNAFYWRDSNAPESTINVTEHSTTNATVTITATDVATDIGTGSGVANIYYNYNGGAWQTYSSPLSISTIGLTTINYYAIDELDNNVGSEAYALTLAGGGTVTCTLINLFPLLLMAIAFVGGGGLMAYRKMGTGEIKAMVTYIITLIIGVVILISVLPIMC